MVPVSMQPFATTLVTSSCSGPHAMMTTTSDTRWVMPDLTMSTDHTKLAPEVFLITNGCKRNKEYVVHFYMYAHRMNKTVRQQFPFSRASILMVRSLVAFGSAIFSVLSTHIRLFIDLRVACREVSNCEPRNRKVITTIVYCR